MSFQMTLALLFFEKHHAFYFRLISNLRPRITKFDYPYVFKAAIGNKF